MASVTTNMDINVLANITLESLKVGLQPLTKWSTGFRSDARLNDSAKVFVNSMTLDATDFDVETNNYEDSGDDTTIGVDVQMTDKIKKTAFVDEEDYSKIISGVNIARLSNNPIELKIEDLKKIIQS